jgi:hypothetical protein
MYTHIKRWTLPSHYVGTTWESYYSAGVGQSRDSDALERANFQAMLTLLKACPEIEVGDERSVQVVRESHWAVGWVEWIAIHESDTVALAVADEAMERLGDYPVLNEDLFSQFEGEECNTIWSDCFDMRERVQYFRKHSHTVSNWRSLMAAMRGSWYDAANMLHSPSDLIS